MEVTGKEIAEKLGISPATVSLALNNRPGVNPQTRAAILACREELAKSQETTPEIRKVYLLNDSPLESANDFGLFQISYMELFRVLNEHGYLLQVQVYERNKDSFAELIGRICREKPAGIILFAVNLPQNCFSLLKGIGIPLLIFDHNYQTAGADNVLIDNENGVRQALELFAQEGFQTVYYFYHGTSANYNFKVRRRAFEDAVSEYPGLLGRQFDCGSRIPQIRQNALAFLREHQGERVGILMENYEVSLGLLYAIQMMASTAGKYPDIPGEMLPISFDEIPDTVFLPVPVPMIRVPHINKARIGVERLIERMEGRVSEEILYMVHTVLE